VVAPGWRAERLRAEGWRSPLAAVGICLTSILAVARAGASLGDPFVDNRPSATVDWRRGAIQATGGAAADHRMPSADAARPGAERRARAAARARLAEALRSLPLGGGRHLDEAAVTRAVNRARELEVELQSNGGAQVRMEITFGDWEELAGATGAGIDRGAEGGSPGTGDQPTTPVGLLALSLPEARLAAAPMVVVGQREVALGSARYTGISGMPEGLRPLPGHVDQKGRLVLSGRESAQDLAGRAVMVYVQKILR